MTHLPTSQYNVQLYSCADSEVQTAIINTYPDWFKHIASKLIKMLEGIVTQKSNPLVHRLGLSNISQAETETWDMPRKRPSMGGLLLNHAMVLHQWMPLWHM